MVLLLTAAAVIVGSREANYSMLHVQTVVGIQKMIINQSKTTVLPQIGTLEQHSQGRKSQYNVSVSDSLLLLMAAGVFLL